MKHSSATADLQILVLPQIFRQCKINAWKILLLNHEKNRLNDHDE